MAFSKTTVLAVIAASTALVAVDAFAPASSQSVFSRPVISAQKYQPISVSLTAVDDIIGEDEDVDNPAPEDFIVSAGDLEDEPTDMIEDEVTDGRFEHVERIKELQLQYRRHDTDTGSPEFQVAGMTERIQYLTKHLKLHPKDFSTRRGLVALVNKRRRLLNYLYKEDLDRYQVIMKSLGIRHKAPTRVLSSEDKYGRFPQQKERKEKKRKN